MKQRQSLLALVLLLLAVCVPALAQEKLLTIDDIFDPVKKVNFSGTTPNIRWLKDGTHYLLTNEASKKNVPRLQRVNALTGEATAFLDAAKMEAAFAALGGFSAQDAKQLASRSSYEFNENETAVLINFANDLFYYELGSNKALRVTNNPEEEVGETFSPDARMVGFVRNNNMYVYDLATQRERRLTTDGAPKILNGRLDWVYQEELYGRGDFQAYWWSPDSTMLAYLRLDENPVHEFTVVDHIPYRQDVEVTPYPKAGDPNPVVQLGVVDASGGAPVFQYTYAGPSAPQVRNTWGGASYMWHQLLAQKGYIIWIVDNRTASSKGTEPAWQVYKNFGELELRDIEDGLKWLKTQPYVDASRIGIWGWSYGGFMTSYALTHSKSFKLGIAGGSVTDWRNYDTIYTERYMQTPQNNPEGYRKSSPVHAARDLSGKLLLIHGVIDDNVHMQNTIQFVYELQKAGKQFELMIYPKSRHGVTDPLLVKHMRTMMTEFIVANL